MLTNIELAKAKLALFAPEWIALCSRLEFVETERIPTAGTDGRRIFYNPTFVDSLPLKQVIGLIIHELGHNMYAHMTRMQQRDPRLANCAMDIVLNKNIQQYFEETRSTLNAELPPTELVGAKWAKYKGWNWEKVYADMKGEQEKGGKDSGPAQFDYVEPGVNEDGTPASQAEMEVLAKEWTMAAQQAATMAKARGVGSGMFEEFVSNLIHTKVDWQAQLWDVFTKTAKDDQSWRRFNRKLVSSEIYMPGMYSEHIGLVVFMMDTSGSMESDCFKLGLGVMNEILDSVKPERIVFGCCDTTMQSVEELTSDDLPVVARVFKGRGGTVLTPIFEYVKGMEETPELVVLLSDGQCDQIDKSLEPACPMVWLLTTDSTQAAEGSFGKIIRVEV